MDTAQWAQGIGVVKKPLLEEGRSSSSLMMSTRPAPPPQSGLQQSESQSQLVERGARPAKEQALHCPRCNSTNTKFCYYNNYSLTQPRYFCKTCRRYWTEGGSLRNVPVGGGSRKNKRHSSSTNSTTTTSSSKLGNVQQQPHLPAMTSSISHIAATKQPHQGQDLSLAFPNSNSFPGLIGGGFPASISGGELSAMELLRSTGLTARGLGPLVHMSMAPETGAVYGGAGFGLHDFSSAGAGSVENGNGNGNGYVMQEGGGRLLFPFGELKQVHVKSGNENIDDEQNREQQGGDHPSIFWNGANLGGGGSW